MKQEESRTKSVIPDPTSVHTIDDVIATMLTLDRVLAPSDGVRWFNFLYRLVTERVRQEESWRERRWFEHLDVIFARLYFSALSTWENSPDQTPHCWRALLRERFNPHIARIQFALAGMNAHINHDLSLALVESSGLSGDFPLRSSGQYADFQKTNELLEEVQARALETLATGILGQIEQSLGDVDNILATWKVRHARESAWVNGEVLWHLRTTVRLKREFVERMDRMTGFAGKGLLIPVYRE